MLTLTKARELRETVGALADENRALLDSAEGDGRDLTDAEQEEFDRRMDDIKELRARANRIEAQHELDDDLDTRTSEPIRPEVPGQGSAGASWRGRDGREVRVLGPDEELRSVVSTPREPLSFGRYVRGIATGRWEGAEAERRALSEGLGADGGYLVPAPLSARIIDLARTRSSVMRAGARTVPMESKTLDIARVSQDPAPEWKAENAAATKSEPQFERVTLSAKTLIGLVPMSVELAEDAPNIDAVVENTLSESLALELDRAALRGDGTGEEPTGLRNIAGVQVIDMGTDGAALSGYAEFSQAVQNVREQNGTPNALIMAPRTAGVVDRFEDANGQPLRPLASYQELTRLVSNQIPTDLDHGTATDATEAYVGDFSKLLVGMRTELRIEVSRQAGSAFEDLQVWIRAYLRADVALEQETHFCVIDGITAA